MLYCIYPWVVIGNGFRYGRWYLHYAQVVALSGLPCGRGVQHLLAQQHPLLGAALLLRADRRSPVRVGPALQRCTRRAPQAEAANTAKTKFLAAASHDLRQPMQALSMYASVLEERVTDAERAARGAWRPALGDHARAPVRQRARYLEDRGRGDQAQPWRAFRADAADRAGGRGRAAVRCAEGHRVARWSARSVAACAATPRCSSACSRTW